MPIIRIETKAGTASLEYSPKGIVSFTLPQKDGTHLVKKKNHGAIEKEDGLGNAGLENAEKAASLLKLYYEGEQVAFNSLMVDLETCSAFFKEICEVVRDIPYGAVISYGEVAKMADRPKAARAVGRAMASNHVPIIIPCHRVIASDGRLTGYSAEGGLETKESLLIMEGLSFDGPFVVNK